MRIVSWTLAGPATEAIIHDALASLSGLADHMLVIDTTRNEEPRPALVNLAFCNASVTCWPWRDHFGDARNAGNDMAAALGEALGARWAVMVDTDERVQCKDASAVRAFLAAQPPEVLVVLAHAADGSHTRERFFRLPCRRPFAGRTHERFLVAHAGEQAIIPPDLIAWTELPKTGEQLDAKFARDAELLRLDVADNPQDGGAWFYLGRTLQSLGRHEDAVAAFRECLAVDTIEGGAWAAFCAGESLLELGRFDRALDAALAGMARDAGAAELYWLAALASLYAAHGGKQPVERPDPWRLEQARCWAEAAKVHQRGSAAERRRVGFRSVRGLTVGPDEVLAACRAGGAR